VANPNLIKEESDNEEGNEELLEEAQKLAKLFPTVEDNQYEFENFDEYEENLELLDFIKKNNEQIGNENEIEEEPVVKIKEVEKNIIIYDYDF
jgi:hypothetical protein